MRNLDKGNQLEGLFHDEADEKIAFLLSRMRFDAGYPEPMGVFYRIADECYEDMLERQTRDAIQQRGDGNLHKLFHSGDTWEVTA